MSVVDQHNQSEKRDEVSGIGGWLLLPILHLLLDVFWFGYLIYQALALGVSTVPAGSTPGSPDISSSGAMASVAFVVFDFFVLIYALYCLVRFFQKKEQVPALMIGFYVLIILKAFINAALLDTFPELGSGQDEYDAWRAVIQSIIAGAIWISYFRTSVRVQNTFVARDDVHPLADEFA